MPDISLCTTPDCPLAGTCYRKWAKPKPTWQSMRRFEFVEDGGEVECPGYIEHWPAPPEGQTGL